MVLKYILIKPITDITGSVYEIRFQKFRMELKFVNKYVLIICLLIAMTNTISALAQPNKDLWQMNGTLVKYAYAENADSGREHIILELKDTNAIPVWFAVDIHRSVCFTDKCRPLNLWIFWNGTGGYLGFDLYNDDPLTKTDHESFSQADYSKLHWLLADTAPIIKYIKEEDLVVDTAIHTEEVDGYSGATRPSLQQELVQDAAYTCYTLWHIVYGTIQKEIGKLIDQRVNSSYLKSVFDHQESTYKLWAINFIKRHPQYDSAFSSTVIELITSDDENLSKQALNYFESIRLSEPGTQLKLTSMMDVFPEQRGYELLWKLKKLDKVNDKTILILLEKFNEGKIKTPLLGYIYDLIQPENLQDDGIKKILKDLVSHKNLYVRKLTSQLLDKYKQ